MTLDQTTTISLSFAASSLAVVVVLSHKLGDYKRKVDILWKQKEDTDYFLLQNALVEAKQKGVLVVNSPLRLSDEVSRILAPLALDLKAFFLNHDWPIGDPMRYDPPEFGRLLELHSAYGDQIEDLMCSTTGATRPAALIGAYEYARQLAANTNFDLNNKPNIMVCKAGS